MLARRSPDRDRCYGRAVKTGDSVIASRYAGPPREDATVVSLGEEAQTSLTGQTSTVQTATVRFADKQTATVAVDSLLPGGPYYVVTTPDGQTWCDSAEQIAEAIATYVESSAEGATLNKVSVVFMPPSQGRTGTGQQLSPTDFYVG